jgi:membrane fusion protein (multidrug efflux system)
MPAAARVTASPICRVHLTALAFAGALMLAACQRNDPADAAKAASAPPPAVPVHTVHVAPRSVPVRFEVVGQVEGSKEVEVRARVGGILQKQDYHEGDPVRAGQLLFEIDPAQYEIAVAQARAQLAQEQAKLAQARRDEARLKPLAADRAVSQKEYDDALSAMQSSQAAVQQASANLRQAELNLSYTRVTAPVHGVSGRALHSIGTLVTTDAAGSLLTSINQVTPVWVRFSLAQSDLAKVPGGRITRNLPAQVELVLPDGSPYPNKGRLNFAASEYDPKLGTQQLRAEVDNPKEQLLPGQFVRVRITAGERSNVFLVPQAAVMQTEKTSLVFVVGPDGKAQARPVTPGDWYGNEWSILSGLEAGDRVIVDNLLKVRPGIAVTEVAPAQPAANAPGAAAPATGNHPAAGQSEPSANAPGAGTPPRPGAK